MRQLPPSSEEAREWLRLAARDLRLAELALKDAPPLTGEALYHMQQAAEKALKGFLVSRRVEYPLTHDLRTLLQRCAKLDASLVDSVASAADLTLVIARKPSRRDLLVVTAGGLDAGPR